MEENLTTNKRMVKWETSWKYFLIIPISALILTFWWQLTDGNIQNIAVANILIGVINTAGIWLGCMAIVNYLWYKYPWEYHPVKHLLIEFFAILIYTVLFSILMFIFLRKLDFVEEEMSTIGEEISISLLITYLITTLHEAYFFYKQWKLNFSKSVKLEKENIHAKYETLKTQINPHFLFNSLNSLVTLVDNNEKATNYIMDLSDFLRYMLKSREREVVLLREEISVLKKYIGLQKTRFGENLNITIDVDEKYYHYALPPLVLQMLVENCIKHNIISKSKPLNIFVKTQGENIIVENNLQQKEDVPSTGHGIYNIQERYGYLTTKNVDIKKTNNKFIVSIPIVLVDL